ncbi:MAG TPA: stage III sporulation protein AF [Clostridiales bacterium]|nr:stage III sporulation protein AF [Clostridiales bacterium]
MEELYSWIRNIVIYMIMNTIVMNLLGNKSYKKYISIVSGMILVLIVITPVLRVIKLDESLDYFFNSNNFTVDTSEFKKELEGVEREQQEAIFAEYEDGIREQVKELLQKRDISVDYVDVIFNMDSESENFGSVEGMDIRAVAAGDGDSGDKNRLDIDEIKIAQITIGEEEKTSEKQAPSPLEITIKKELADFYNMEQGNINISIQGG